MVEINTWFSTLKACDIFLFSLMFLLAWMWLLQISFRNVWAYVSSYIDCSTWQITLPLLVYKSLRQNYHLHPFFSLDDNSLKDRSCFCSFTFFFFVYFTSLSASCFSSFSCLVIFPNSFVMSKLLGSFDFLRAVTFGCHSMHIDLRILLAQSLLEKVFPKLSNLLIKWRKWVCLDSTNYWGSIQKCS